MKERIRGSELVSEDIENGEGLRAKDIETDLER